LHELPGLASCALGCRARCCCAWRCLCLMLLRQQWCGGPCPDKPGLPKAWGHPRHSCTLGHLSWQGLAWPAGLRVPSLSAGRATAPSWPAKAGPGQPLQAARPPLQAGPAALQAGPGSPM